MQEPTKHQYDWDVATTMGFLNQYGLSAEFKLNVECNHATLAGHSCDHELQVCTHPRHPASQRSSSMCAGLDGAAETPCNVTLVYTICKGDALCHVLALVLVTAVASRTAIRAHITT